MHPDGKVVEQLTIDNYTVKTNFAEMDIKSASVSMVSKTISIFVVPIKVTHGETKREVSTFAMLDNCSQHCFIKNSIRLNTWSKWQEDRNNYQNIKWGSRGCINCDFRVEGCKWYGRKDTILVEFNSNIH